MTTRNAVVKARINDQLKNYVDLIFETLGLTASDAINMFYKQVELHNGLPFELKIPNRETEKTFRATDAGKGLNYAKNVKDMFDQLDR
jgi:DNA-damage-inducible protein J